MMSLTLFLLVLNSKLVVLLVIVGYNRFGISRSLAIVREFISLKRSQRRGYTVLSTYDASIV